MIASESWHQIVASLALVIAGWCPISAPYPTPPMSSQVNVIRHRRVRHTCSTVLVGERAAPSLLIPQFSNLSIHMLCHILYAGPRGICSNRGLPGQLVVNKICEASIHLEALLVNHICPLISGASNMPDVPRSGWLQTAKYEC